MVFESMQVHTVLYRNNSNLHVHTVHVHIVICLHVHVEVETGIEVHSVQELSL